MSTNDLLEPSSELQTGAFQILEKSDEPPANAAENGAHGTSLVAS